MRVGMCLSIQAPKRISGQTINRNPSDGAFIFLKLGLSLILGNFVELVNVSHGANAI